jgi:hypothetical protein
LGLIKETAQLRSIAETVICISGLVLADLLLPCLLATAYSAPLPQPKSKIRPDLSGAWTAKWSGSEWPTVLLPDGTYVAERAGGPRYEGRWKLDGDELTIEERLRNEYGYGQVYRHTFTLQPGKTHTRCGSLTLERVR